MRVVAEGIESGAQYRALRRMRCEFGQGHFLGSPVDATELSASQTPTFPERRAV